MNQKVLKEVTIPKHWLSKHIARDKFKCQVVLSKQLWARFIKAFASVFLPQTWWFIYQPGAPNRRSHVNRADYVFRWICLGQCSPTDFHGPTEHV